MKKKEKLKKFDIPKVEVNDLLNYNYNFETLKKAFNEVISVGPIPLIPIV